MTSTDTLPGIDELIVSLREQVASDETTAADLQWFLGLSRERRDELMGNKEEVDETPTPILRCLSREPIVIGATDGNGVVSNAVKVFPGYIDSDFRGLAAHGIATPDTPTMVYEMAQDATFAQMFGSFGVETKQLCLSQDQIIEFCRNHRDQLRTDGYATFFLFKSKGKFFVAHVDFVVLGRLWVYVYRFAYDGVWVAECRRRVVVPQL